MIVREKPGVIRVRVRRLPDGQWQGRVWWEGRFGEVIREATSSSLLAVLRVMRVAVQVEVGYRVREWLRRMR